MRKLIRLISTSTDHSQVTQKDKGFDNCETEHLSKDISSEAAAIYGGTTATVEYPATPNLRDTTSTQTREIDLSSISNHWSGALQTVLDQPPSTLPLRLVLGGMVFCLAFGAWAWWGNIEEVGRAQGQLVPQGEPYKINPVVSGKVVRIAVEEGEVVKAGQVLLELDSQIAANEVERLQKELVSYQTQLIQTQGTIDKARLEVQTHAAIADAREKVQLAVIAQAQAKVEAVQKTIAQSEDKIRTTTELLLQMRSDADALKVRRETLKPLTTIAAERQLQLQDDVKAQQARLERLKPLVQEGAIAKERLYDVEQAVRDREGAITQSQLQEATNVKEQLFQADQQLRDRQRSIIQNQGELKQAKEELGRLQAELKQAQAQISRLQAEQGQNQAERHQTQLEDQQKIQQLEVQKTQLQAKANETEKVLSKAKTELKQLLFTAPVDGIVSALNIRNPGEVVQPGQTLAELAPQDAPLILLAKLPNQEAGFVKTGMPVKVKLDAYPYQDYGIVSGQVRSISPDAKPDERLGAVYRVEVALERNAVAANHHTIPFKAGQTATADIIIRRRRIIDVLLDPLKQLQKGGLDL